MKKQNVILLSLGGIITVGVALLGYFHREVVKEKIDELTDNIRSRFAPEVDE